MTAFHTVLEAASRYAADVAPLPHSLVKRGDLRIVEPPPGHKGRKRLALVRSVAPDMNVAQIMLTHTYPELADDADAVLSPEQSRLPFPVVVETHVWGSVWRSQVRSRLGYLSETQLESIREAVSGEATSAQGVHVGLPSAGLADHRRSIAEQEMKELDDLTWHCTEALLDEEPPWRRDPAVLSPTRLKDPSSASNLLEMAHRAIICKTNFTLSDLKSASVEDPSFLDRDHWISELGHHRGGQAYDCLIPVLDRALSHSESDRVLMAA